MADVLLRDIGKSFGALEVLRHIDLDIRHGEFVVFVGPSGCGKSTLLRMIAGLEDITAGDLLIDGEICNDIAPRDRGIAMVFQSYALYPHMTVYENVGFALKMAGTPKSEADAKIRDAARILQMEELLERKPAQLSGGQRQRVAIGRAIVRHPKVFLFDEPLSNLDAALRVDMRMEIARLHQELDATMIYVTHDQVEAMTLADKIVVLEKGEIMQVGPPLELYRRPANLFVAGFIGSPKMNLLPVRRTGGDGGRVEVASDDVAATTFALGPAAAGAPEKLILGVRPQSLRLVPAEQARIRATVLLVERLGDETVMNVRLPSGTTALALAAGTAEVEPGDRIGLDFDAAEAHLFLPSGPRLAPEAAIEAIPA
ncbi:ABC transporter ATP-binding protein [Wenxinia marina]|uniref:Carbohydrate ABC transporter ATP-binding protein, CUT1 family n=1 Tax=Wenxinia marina DSM 24838 TaxID=1123501 RepID=A0A0D0QFK8_9RHOB|nr:sn-glycerol-3-phosphate ABC transporter ATP-binding protein UgpC [Wenxinia marina]KIQ69783.1 carbohydrate ABC transporter ATP-binding protein, CUT1 family [Wenxinia marina DSM 24838]GGL61177.1 sugar ABC transporter ATP-binding protein [Wenxinia marina]